MSSAADYIAASARRNKWLQSADGTQIKLDVKSIRKLLADAFDKGYAAGKASNSLFDTIFGDSFGGKK